MIIGIFGDSFAESINNLSWSTLLKTSYGFTVENYAKACTSAFWSFSKLKFYINDIDTIVFVLTAPGRLYHSDDKYLAVSSMFTVRDNLQNSKISGIDRKVFEAAEQYYLLLDNPEFNDFVQNQIIKEVTQLAKIHNKQLLIVPAFRESTDDRSIFKLSLIFLLYFCLLQSFD